VTPSTSRVGVDQGTPVVPRCSASLQSLVAVPRCSPRCSHLVPRCSPLLLLSLVAVRRCRASPSLQSLVAVPRCHDHGHSRCRPSLQSLGAVPHPRCSPSLPCSWGPSLQSLITVPRVGVPRCGSPIVAVPCCHALVAMPCCSPSLPCLVPWFPFSIQSLV
jgi:hypothetical protein